MASSPLSSEDDVFERLKSAVDPAVVSEREKAVEDRVRAHYEKAQQRLSELIENNSTLPVTIADIRIHGIKKTREGFLRGVFAEALKEEKQRSYTLKSAMEELQQTTDKLHQFGIFHPTISMYLDQVSSDASDRTALSALLSVNERGRLLLKTGTELGNAEGGGYLNATIRNVFGGAESIHASATTATSTADVGHRTRSSYELTFATPVASNPDTVVDIGGFAVSKSNHFFASHEEASQGVRAGLRFLSSAGEHELQYTGIWRQLTNLSPGASPSIRADAGDSVKSSITYTQTRDTRDSKLLATRGTLLKGTLELAGFGGDVAFFKNELESQHNIPLPHGVSFTTGFRMGLLVPLPLFLRESPGAPLPSRINDRFFLGGATDIRGFREHGLGPRDGNDAVGGDAYVAAGASVLLPLPRMGPESPFRFQAFVNGGRLVGLQQRPDGNVGRSIVDMVSEMGVGLPSIAAGVGLVYSHPVARFELNFALPVVKREGERARKGLQLGLGISFL